MLFNSLTRIQQLEAADPYYNNVKFLTNFTNGYADAKGNSTSLLGSNVSVTGGSLVIAGTGQGRVQSANTVETFNTTDFVTLEGFIKTSAGYAFCTLSSTADNTGRWNFATNAANRLTAELYGVGYHTFTFTVPGLNILDNQWHHWAYTRGSGSMAWMYIDGIRCDTSIYMPRPFIGGVIQVGPYFGTHSYVGSIGAFRYTKTVERYTGPSFTPPTDPFPEQ